MRAPANSADSTASARPRAGLAAVGRTLLAIGAIVPGLLAGLGVLATTRQRRRAANRAFAVWSRLGLAAAGIQLEVEEGRHLELRPAVFLFNHQSAVDPLLVCALLRRNFVGVAKREVRRYPLVGAAFAFAGTLFLDRGDHEQALRALEPGIEALGRGLAVAITPEGTRSAGRAVGAFKKGAFRLAVAAGVPIVPCVIHDARKVLPRRAWLMRPGRVRVTVHAPLATQGWTSADLDREIAAVRRLYTEALGG